MCAGDTLLLVGKVCFRQHQHERTTAFRIAGRGSKRRQLARSGRTAFVIWRRGSGTTLAFDGRLFQQLGSSNSERSCDLFNDRDRGISGAPFEVGHIRPMDAGLEGELLLAEVLRLPQTTHVPTEALLDVHSAA